MSASSSVTNGPRFSRAGDSSGLRYETEANHPRGVS